MESVSLYSEARNEYMKQLCTWIIPPIVEFFRKEYNTLLVSHGRKAMSAFQDFCATVPRWNQDVIDENINIILDACHCDYIEELMTAVFIAHTKMLTAIRVNSKQKKLQITLPKLDHFLHRVFTECARAFWKAPFLFSEDLSPIEKQKNILQAESMCNEALGSAVRSLLPVKAILRDYLDDDDDAEDVPMKKDAVVESESDEEPEPTPAPVPAPVPVHAPAPVPAPVPAPEIPVVSVPEIPTTVSEIPEIPVASASAPASEKPQPPVIQHSQTFVEKLDTPPGPILQHESSHSLDHVEEKPQSVHLEKDETPQNVVIDTEPSVHFTPYDTVYDETTENISEIRYVPKVSVEEIPRIALDSSGGSELSMDDIENVDTDDEVPLDTFDFEEIK